MPSCAVAVWPGLTAPAAPVAPATAAARNLRRSSFEVEVLLEFLAGIPGVTLDTKNAFERPPVPLASNAAFAYVTAWGGA